MLSVILPTYNEVGNIEKLLKGIADVLKGEDFEMIVVDDNSPDRTWQKAEALKAEYPYLHVIRRTKEKGLSSAIVCGFNEAKGNVLLTMDTDLQHDPAIITALNAAIGNGADVAVASRYIEGGSVGEWVAGRRYLSKTATALASRLPRVRSTDPMSGFFALSRSSFEHVRASLRPTGFKILFEILSFLPKQSVLTEVPLTFAMRGSGESKLSFRVELQFLWQLFRIGLIRMQAALFLLVASIILLCTLTRLFALLPLYLDAEARRSVQASLTQMADERGWLLSDLSVRSVSRDSMTILHRFHHRGVDEVRCYNVDFQSSSVIPCGN